MITPTALLSLMPSLPQGAARQPGGGAFVLPGGEAAAGDDAALLPSEDGGERQDEAAGGNGLPLAASAIDPWLVATLLSPAPLAPERMPTSTDVAANATPIVPAIARTAATLTPAGPTSSTAGADKTLAASILAAASAVPPESINRPAVAPPIEIEDVVVDRLARAGPTIPADRTGREPTRDAAPQSAIASSTSPLSAPAAPSIERRPLAESGRRIGAGTAARVPQKQRDETDDAFAPTVARAVSVEAPRIEGTAVTVETSTRPAAPTSTRPAGTSTTDIAAAPLPTPPASPARSRDASLPGTALRSSALTPLQRDEVATVAALVAATPTRSAVAPRPDDVPAATIAPRAVPLEIAALADPAASTAPSARADPAISATSAAATAMDTAIVEPVAASSVARVDAPSTPAVALPLGWHLSPPTPVASSPLIPRPDAAVASPTSSSLSARVDEPAAFATQAADRPATTADRPLPRPTTPVTTTPAEQPVAAADALPTGAPAPRMATMPGQTTLRQPATPAPVAPSSVVFGAARYAAQASDRRDEPAPSIGGIATGAALAPQPALAAAPVAHAPIDVRHERWPTTMIERIEMIRDAANEADTRIRLVPDALGPIDVDVRRDGDTLHVRFTAEQPQARALLQDAQPRLADAAEARGLRLGQTTVGGDASGLAQQQSQQGRQPPHPAAPARPRQFTAEAKADADDTRLA